MRTESTKPKSLPCRLAWSAVRVGLMLAVIIVAVWYLIAQPTMTSNTPSTKSTGKDDPATSPKAATGPERLRGHVLALSETFHPRDWENPANLDRCAEYIADHLRQAGATVEFQEFKVETNNYRNVIGRFGVGKEKKIIVGAHYDSCGVTPGADDNASGVAGLLELAKMIGENPPDAELELVAYTLEEPPFFGTPLMGSAKHAKSVAGEKDRIAGVIVLEMIGYYNDAPGSQSYPMPALKLLYPDRGNFITVVSRFDQGSWVKKLKNAMKDATRLPVYSFRGPESLPGVDFSDHRNYWPHGIPAAMITNTAFYRNTEYHKPGDTADRLVTR
jgi:Peptidase family M28